jgi:hypothetical protein
MELNSYVRQRIWSQVLVMSDENFLEGRVYKDGEDKKIRLS